MKFYANMKMIHLIREDGLYSNEYLLELLTKLLKNGSKKEFRDEIHYTIAGIHSSEGDFDLAIEHLQESITNSKSNLVQKSMSFRELGEIYLISLILNLGAVVRLYLRRCSRNYAWAFGFGRFPRHTFRAG